MTESRLSKAVTAICIEVADPTMMEQWLQQGLMPNLTKIRSEGMWTRLQSVTEISSGAVWPTFFTGVDPSDHGQCFTHMQLLPGTYEIVKKYADDVPYEPFWMDFQQQGLTCAIIDVPQTYPATDFNGIHIAGWGGEYPAWPYSSSPEDLTKEITRRFGNHPLADKYRIAAKPKTHKGYKSLVHDLLRGAQLKADLSRWIHAQGPHDFFMTVFSEPHWAMHLLWDVLDQTHPRSSQESYHTYGKVLEALVVIIDHFIGEMRKARPMAELLVFSLSGMGPNYSGKHVLQNVLDCIGMGPAPKRNGYKRVLWPPQRWGSRITRAVDEVLPFQTIETAKTLVPKRVWDYWTRRLLHANHGWNQSRAFCVPNDYSGAIRINLEGREPEGKVKPGREYQQVCDEITSTLMELSHIDSGRPVVREVVQTDKVYTGKNLDALPDLIVLWQNDSPINGVVSPRAGQIQQPVLKRRTGAHRAHGFFAAAGPQIGQGADLDSIHLLDLAPTISSLLEVSPSSRYRGRVVSEMIIRAN